MAGVTLRIEVAFTDLVGAGQWGRTPCRLCPFPEIDRDQVYGV